MEGKTKRQGIFDGLCAELDQNLKNRRGHLHSLRESLGSETKSSAGDKHETGRAMIHSEQARVQDSVNRLEAMLSKLRQYAAVIGPIQRVSPGALVETTGPWVLVGVPSVSWRSITMDAPESPPMTSHFQSECMIVWYLVAVSYLLLPFQPVVAPCEMS